MDEEESRLRYALLAQVGNASRDFSANDVSQAVVAATGLGNAIFHTTPVFPACFLIVCANQEARDRALASSPTSLTAASLSLRPWMWLVRASSRTLYHKVCMELDGIPEHAWCRDTASKLLASHGWIEKLDHATENKTDMTTFKLTA
ncbi:unnamed protein product [Urochloa humidicola]